MAREFLSVGEVAVALGVSTVRTYQLVNEHRIPHVRRGRRVLIPVDAWRAWIAQQTSAALEAVQR